MQSKLQIKSIGIDLGKTIFHFIALGNRSQVVIRKKFSRSQLLEYTVNLPSSLIGMEAGVGSHFLGRALREQGHEVRLIPAQFVRPFVKSNKNDYRDAEAIAEAVERENMRFVPIKTEDELDLQILHRVRDPPRTSAINQIRAFLLERGISFSQGAGQPASADARDPGKHRRKTEHGHASSIGYPVAGVERPADADREPEQRTGADCQQRSELCSITADPWRGTTGVDSRRISHRQQSGFQKRRDFAALLGLVPLLGISLVARGGALLYL
jgi:transposase